MEVDSISIGTPEGYIFFAKPKEYCPVYLPRKEFYGFITFIPQYTAGDRRSYWKPVADVSSVVLRKVVDRGAALVFTLSGT